MNKFFGHLSTVAKHRRKVFTHCCKAGIPFQGLTHDLSKYSPTEFRPGVKYYQGFRSPNVAERNDIGYSSAWLHHKGRNRHHFEYWTDYLPGVREVTPVEMPAKYLVEMCMDRIAACRVYNGVAYTDADPLNYFRKDKENRFMHPNTKQALDDLLQLLSDQGEEALFAHIKTKILGK